MHTYTHARALTYTDAHAHIYTCACAHLKVGRITFESQFSLSFQYVGPGDEIQVLRWHVLGSTVSSH